MPKPLDNQAELRKNIEMYVAGLAESGLNFQHPEMVSREVRADYVNSLVRLFNKELARREAEARKIPKEPKNKAINNVQAVHQTWLTAKGKFALEQIKQGKNPTLKEIDELWEEFNQHAPKEG